MGQRLDPAVAVAAGGRDSCMGSQGAGPVPPSPPFFLLCLHRSESALQTTPREPEREDQILSLFQARAGPGAASKGDSAGETQTEGSKLR